jgi:acetyl-CoA carboxylase biotin carboxyl carrier protein
MDRDEIREIVNYVVRNDVREFALERKDASLKLKRRADHSCSDGSPLLPFFGQAATAPTGTTKSLHVVKSSIVGIFHESPTPGSPPFVCVGLMNEIEADVPGEVVQQLAANGQPVDYGRPLFEIRPCE